MRAVSQVVRQIRRALSLPAADSLRKPRWRGRRRKTAGHCYVASEAIFWRLGGPASGLVPASGRVRGAVHWWLEDKETGKVVDATSDQFQSPPDYRKIGRRRGFLTAEPSLRAKILAELAWPAS